MQLLKFIRLILTFYKNFFLASFIITAVCAQIFWKYGIETFAVLFWFKIITLALIFYFIKTYKAKEFYYYQNLGISKITLWITTLVTDFALFVILLALTYKIK